MEIEQKKEPWPRAVMAQEDEARVRQTIESLV